MQCAGDVRNTESEMKQTADDNTDEFMSDSDGTATPDGSQSESEQSETADVEEPDSAAAQTVAQ